MKKRDKKRYDDDDGRVISPMNVDGMPWHRKDIAEHPERQAEGKSEQDEIILTDSEKRAMAGGVFAAALLVAGVFVLAGLLVVLFCVFVWLR